MDEILKTYFIIIYYFYPIIWRQRQHHLSVMSRAKQDVLTALLDDSFQLLHLGHPLDNLANIRKIPCQRIQKSLRENIS